MTNAIRKALISCLFVATCAQAAVPATGSAAGPSQFGHDKQTELMIRATAFALKAYPNYRAMVDHLANKADRQYLVRQLGHSLLQPIQARYLERNILLLTADGENIPITVKDFDHRHFSVFKHDFVFNPSESAEHAIRRLSTSFEHASLLDLLEPQARAINPVTVFKWAAFAYVSVAATLGWECVKGGWTSNDKCVEGSALWGPAAGMYGIGMAVLGYQEAKGYMTDKTFELTDISCPKDSKPLVATILDSKQGKMSVTMNYKPDGKPDHINFKATDGQDNLLYFKDDWSPDPGRSPVKANTFESKAAQVVAQGARNLSKLCEGADSAAALAKYQKTKEGTLTVQPDPLDPTASVNKTVK